MLFVKAVLVIETEKEKSKKWKQDNNLIWLGLAASMTLPLQHKVIDAYVFDFKLVLQWKWCRVNIL